MKLHIYIMGSTMGHGSEAGDAAGAIGNYALAYKADIEELPDTPVQRFLSDLGACLPERAEVDGMSTQQLREQLLLRPKWAYWLVIKHALSQDKRWVDVFIDPPTLEAACDWAEREIAEYRHGT